MNTDTSLYHSPPSFRSLRNEYVIYADRIELHCRLPFFPKVFVIPREELESVDVFPSLVFRTSRTALKLDLADLYEHVGITRRHGWFKQLRFTPDDPAAFVAQAQHLLQSDTPA